ncbi:hypothetical protein [Rhizobium leguminosarum]|uniref:hypothetical protein n=1 Tax=Rhizobium leguminosarum TaxID=384 RepID=UPI003F97B7C4
MSKDTAKTERFQMAVSADWIRKVDDWRFANRVPSRATAIRQLVDMGIENGNGDQRGCNLGDRRIQKTTACKRKSKS